jgi:LacI family transcriptional regulator
MTRPGQRVTLKQVADDCGFSVNTVSRALRDDPHLSDETIRTIKESANRLGYIRNALASSLRSGRSQIVAILVEEIRNPHYSYLVTKMSRALGDAGYVSIVLVTGNKIELERKMVNIALGHAVDGILFFPQGADEEIVQLIRANRVPFVLIDRTVTGVRDADIVRLDDEAGGYAAAKALIDAGHRKFLYLAGPLSNSSQTEREKGILRAFEDAGIPWENCRVVPSKDFLQAIEEKTVIHLMKPIDYTAIISFNDEMGYYAMNALFREGIGVPDDVSIVGFDHVRHVVRYLPTLSSISNVPGRDIATTAVRLLLEKINTPDLDSREFMLPVEMYEGGTVGIPVEAVG